MLQLLLAAPSSGSGKTTALSLMAGLLHPYSGSVKFSCKKNPTAMLPANSGDLFLHDTVRGDLEPRIRDGGRRQWRRRRRCWAPRIF